MGLSTLWRPRPLNATAVDCRQAGGSPSAREVKGSLHRTLPESASRLRLPVRAIPAATFLAPSLTATNAITDTAANPLPAVLSRCASPSRTGSRPPSAPWTPAAHSSILPGAFTATGDVADHRLGVQQRPRPLPLPTLARLYCCRRRAPGARLRLLRRPPLCLCELQSSLGHCYLPLHLTWAQSRWFDFCALQHLTTPPRRPCEHRRLRGRHSTPPRPPSA